MMVYCSYHSANPAAVKCTHCARALCQACDHRVRGFPFCQDCIVAGVELMQQQARVGRYAADARRKSSPFAAGLLSVLVPGLGAAYNGQISKAIFHFALFASLFQLGANTGAAFFVWSVLGVWLFAIVDAYRTAQLIRAGLAPKEEEDAIVRRLYGNPLAWGAVLLVLGALILLHTIFGVVLPVREMLPVALILIGGYMMADFWRRRQAKQSPAAAAFDRHNPPPSVVDFGAERSRIPDFTDAEIGAQARTVERFPFKS